MSYYRTARDLIAKLIKNYEENAIHAALLQHQMPNPTGEKVQRLCEKKLTQQFLCIRKQRGRAAGVDEHHGFILADLASVDHIDQTRECLCRVNRL